MDVNETRALIAALKEAGVSRYKTAELELEFTSVKRNRQPVRRKQLQPSPNGFDLALDLNAAGDPEVAHGEP